MKVSRVKLGRIKLNRTTRWGQSEQEQEQEREN
jgi:hypothetical protein